MTVIIKIGYLEKVLRLFWIKFYILTIFRPDKILGRFQVEVSKIG